MKSTVAAVGLMASLASATAYQPRHFHWRRDNSTASAAPGFTTLTVEVTEVATVTSCAPTITNCPARSGTLSASDLITQVVTNVVHLTETVCPVTEAESISKSLVQEHSTGNLPGSTRTAPAVSATPSAPGVPLTTGGGVPIPGVPSQTNSAQDPTVTSPPATGGGDDDDEDEDDDCPADGEVETSVTEIVSTKIVTMTIGKGSTASVITTAVPTTAVSTVLVPKPTTDGAVKPSASVPAGGSVTGVGSEEPTTTTTATSTGTRTVTIKRPNATGTPGSGSDNGESTGNGSEGECSCPAVTVTVPASTVYVTIGGASSTPTAVAGSGNGSGSGSGNGNGASEPSKTASAQQPATTEDADEGEDDDECPADEEEVVTLSTTVTVAPYPTNGTGAGSAKPTGAAYRRSNKLF